MMTSSNGIFSASLDICAGNSPVTGEFPAQMPVTRSFDVFFDLRLISGWVNNGEFGDLRRHRAHYDVTKMVVMFQQHFLKQFKLVLNYIYLCNLFHREVAKTRTVLSCMCVLKTVFLCLPYKIIVQDQDIYAYIFITLTLTRGVATIVRLYLREVTI